MCEQLDLSGTVAAAVASAALTRDIGKQLLPQELLAKPAPLTRAERNVVQRHCEMGAWLLQQRALQGECISSDATTVALLHHEWWNGHGYPFGLAGQDIPLPARIVSVADVFDALCSERSYKAAWPTELAREYIRNRSGVQFDPACVDAMFGIEPVELAVQYLNVQELAPSAGCARAAHSARRAAGASLLA
jgi:HD-GYP domain-containing protein (c-di-GMP phosphodiesterase class II)